MSFTQAIIKNPTRSLIVVPKASATVITDGTVLAWSSGLAVEGASGTTRPDVIGVANGSIAAADALTQVSVIEPFEKDVWIADAANNSNAAHNGQYMVLSNSSTVNNTGTTNTAGIVQQVGVYGAAADKKILVQFVAE